MPEAEIVSFKLFEEHYWTQEEEIIDILENINNYYSDIDLIHLSNGITYICQYQRLYDLCQSLCEKKINSLYRRMITKEAFLSGCL